MPLSVRTTQLSTGWRSMLRSIFALFKRVAASCVWWAGPGGARCARRRAGGPARRRGARPRHAEDHGADQAGQRRGSIRGAVDPDHGVPPMPHQELDKLGNTSRPDRCSGHDWSSGPSRWRRYVQSHRAVRRRRSRRQSGSAPRRARLRTRWRRRGRRPLPGGPRRRGSRGSRPGMQGRLTNACAAMEW